MKNVKNNKCVQNLYLSYFLANSFHFFQPETCNFYLISYKCSPESYRWKNCSCKCCQCVNAQVFIRMSTLFWHRNIFPPRYFWKKVENCDSKWSFGRNKKVEVEKRSKYSFNELKQYSKLTKAKLKNIELRKSVAVERSYYSKTRMKITNKEKTKPA